jgi:methionine-gamma-lyase
VHRGAQGFVEFATPESRRAPIYIYDRLDEPSRGMLEENLAVAEGGEVAVTNWLPRYNIHTDFCDLTEPGSLARVATEQCRVVYFETPVNPTMELIDMRAIRNEVTNGMPVDRSGEDSHCGGQYLRDAVLPTAFGTWRRPGGAQLDQGYGMIRYGDRRRGNRPSSYFNHLMLYRKDFGGASPKNAWSILVHGLPTLAARMVNQQKCAVHVAEFLTQQPKVAKVIDPGLPNFCQRGLARRRMTTADGAFAPGRILYFELKGKDGDVQAAAEAAERFVDHIAEKAYTITLAVSLGQIKTLIEGPFSMTHVVVPVEEKLSSGLKPGGIRLSLGLENWHDISADLSNALEAV